MQPAAQVVIASCKFARAPDTFCVEPLWVDGASLIRLLCATACLFIVF